MHLSRGLSNISNEAGGQSIAPNLLELCVQMAFKLASYGCAMTDTCLPDSNKVMQRISDLYFVEASTTDWLTTDQHPETAQLIHPCITEDIAEALGVQSFRQVVQVSWNSLYLCYLAHLCKAMTASPALLITTVIHIE